MWKSLSEEERARWNAVDRKKVQAKLGKEGKNGVKLNKVS
jgi:hypothetical protein